MSGAWLVDGVRTPIGRFRRALSRIDAVTLGIVAARELRRRHGPNAISRSVMGNVLQAGNGQNPARQIAVGAGFDPATIGLTLNDVCLSSLTSVSLAADALADTDDCWLVGGIDSMSGGDRALAGDEALTLVIADGLTCALENKAHGCVADVDDQRFAITRTDADMLADASHHRARLARERRFFDGEIVAVDLPNGRLDADEGVRETSVDALAALSPAFGPGGTVTAGNASQMSDGAAVGLVAGEPWVRRRKTRPLARIVASAHVAGPNGSLHQMPAVAIEKLLGQTGHGVSDIGMWEINEAFAGVVIASSRRLGLDPQQVNVNGGAIAIGHPLAASGFRLVLTLARIMNERGIHRGVAALCGGGGQGAALMLELPDPTHHVKGTPT